MPVLDEVDGLPRADLVALDPVRLEGYVRDTGWRRNEHLSKARAAVYERPEDRKRQLRILFDKDLADHVLLTGLAVIALARWEEREPAAVLRELLPVVSSDLVRVREMGPAARQGAIGLDAARDMLNGLKRLLLASAHSVISPQRFYPRLSYTAAEDFLGRCRLGQTERGSFVFTLLCPLDAVPQEASLFDVPFTRRVTRRLMEALGRISRCQTESDCDHLLTQEQGTPDPQPLVSANLCEGLLDLVSVEESALEIGVDWSRVIAEPDRHEIPPRVRFSSTVLPRLQYLAARLRPNTAAERQWLIGPVETLDGDRVNDANQREGDVIVRVLDSEGEPRRARINLLATDYAVANQAHMTNRQVRVRGILRRVGRGFRITEPQEFGLLETAI